MGAQVSARSNGVNEACVVGQLVGEPERRVLPSGTIAMSFSLTVRSPGIKTTSVPMVWYDPPNRFDRWCIGDNIVARGPVVRRFFRSAGGLASATEVVVEKAELTRHRAKAARVLASAQRRLATIAEAIDAEV